MPKKLKILTWHTHGSYLYYLTQSPHDFYVLSKPDRPPGYGGRHGHIPWGDNVIDMPVDRVKDEQFDCILFQDDDQYLKDQHIYLTEDQRRLPKIYLEHDTPREHPTDMPHPVDDPSILLVHVTPFNALMWDNRRTPTRIIEHGVVVPDDARYDGGRPRGLAVVNHLARRGRRLGGDVYRRVHEKVPLELAGMGADEMPGGVGEVLHAQLPAFMAQYRFFFNPIRYTSLGLAVIEAMMVGLPVVALATTEMATVIDNGVSGYADTDIDKLIEHMHRLLADPREARALGDNGRRYALERFGIRRFADDWDAAFRLVTQ
ncbi:MAG TPA: glycosyltransferase family 4 protein [Noviherbaspirillum sp.]|jgi:glycosyltransferase involved in cell wall biosynthesis|uniref:glycosyltransferase n=1 Tax=Noviherbaspirillum sp. TaxID=1926288 RepID=UPI002DDD3912|nr:glycosyltransferase family 4 protein [Noviherbaspirillum sp.]HEV2609373.1 glycosyltransferase family 4 protein [Noviherbaspirillum sp.]